VGTFHFVSAGLNFRSTEINAFLGLRQLKRLDRHIEHRNRNMTQFLATAPSWLWRDFRTEGMSSFALPLIAKDKQGAARVAEAVGRLGIESRPVVAGNILRQPFMQNVHAGTKPVADEIHEFGLYVGNGPHVDSSMVGALIRGLRGID
jgi:CDP-6-deoxy-D-xylo-4-hexulose-3-dehydrase